MSLLIDGGVRLEKKNDRIVIYIEISVDDDSDWVDISISKDTILELLRGEEE